MDIVSIHFHDTQILRVVEDCVADTWTMEVEYPVDWEHNVFERRLLIFYDGHSYQVFEQPLHGCRRYSTQRLLPPKIDGVGSAWGRMQVVEN